ncbi:biotin/lipoyl-binding protein [Sphingobacterium olei]|uniref:Biotin/lipoyl-binding protein n=1 Tax=Sphingobacterium olei TaxID=2571155 RepID=A0A4U0PEC4_9SPHI|nr:biotin/lipoyl-binding protein [Sphingobacterium olei]TJZ61074.1 biotin/lipoyl-binding protein [Sphingobacterium olei]
MKHIHIIPFLLLIVACQSQSKRVDQVDGKVEREQITVVTKVPGKIEKILVQEGDIVQAGDTLAILDIPEVDAKEEQALGALESAEAQYNMAVKGATAGQLVQLQAKVDGLKEQYDFAQKSIDRLNNLLKDSLISQQKYDETYAKYQGAKNQYLAAQAEIAEVKSGTRYEQQVMALGQKDRAKGAVSEVRVAAREKFVVAPQQMTIETINLKIGELALAGYPIFNGYLNESTYFRFTIPENKIGKVKKGATIAIQVPYLDNKIIQGKVVSLKTLSSYANIATAYPDYDQQQTLFEIKVLPVDPQVGQDLLTRTTVKLTLD